MSSKLQNPFHPLDLSIEQLLSIYLRFEQSRKMNRNPKQQLTIDILSQMISCLKGCAPSYIQEIMARAHNKSTLSWNDFLSFLDQQSQMRDHILKWLIHSKAHFKYSKQGNLPLRTHLKGIFYDSVTALRFIEFNEDKYILCTLDKATYVLSAYNQDTIIAITDKFIKTPEQIVMLNQENPIQNISFVKSKPQVKQKSKMVVQKKIIQKEINNKNMDDQVYYTKQRKVINSLFTLFKNLPLEESIQLTHTVAPRLNQKNLTSTTVNNLKEDFAAAGVEKEHQEKKLNISVKTPVQKARNMLNGMQQHRNKIDSPNKSGAKYKNNIYGSVNNSITINTTNNKQYSSLQSIHQAYNSKLHCLAIVYYNLDLVLVKIVKEYSKIFFQQQQCVKIQQDKDTKKNEIIQSIQFYFHKIISKWLVLVLIRVEYKNEYRNANQSYIRAYEIQQRENKRRPQPDCKLKQSFILPLDKHQVLTMAQSGGLHILTLNGRYLAYSEEYDEINKKYFRLQHEEKFKNNKMSLSCIHVEEEVVLFGTLKGVLIVYQSFSHQFKEKSIAECAIVQIQCTENCAVALTTLEKFYIVDMVTMEIMHSYSVKNQDKLHQKIKNFTMKENKLYFYGNAVEIYCKEVDEESYHKQKRMENMWKWRQNKIQNQKDDKINNNNKSKNTINVFPTTIIQHITIGRQIYVGLTQFLELLILNKITNVLQHSMILNIQHNQKVSKMQLSPDDKQIMLLLFDQQIYIFNIYTQEKCLHMKPTPSLRPTSVTFLDLKNEYSIAIGTQSGKIVLWKEKMKVLQHHTSSVHMLKLHNSTMISCSEDGVVAFWVLPFNFLRQEYHLKDSVEGFGEYSKGVLLRCGSGKIFQVSEENMFEVKYAKQSIGCVDQKIVCGIEDRQFIVREGKQVIFKEVINHKYEVKYMYCGDNQKVIIFMSNGQVLCWKYGSAKIKQLANFFGK